MGLSAVQVGLLKRIFVFAKFYFKSKRKEIYIDGRVRVIFGLFMKSRKQKL